MRHHAAMYAVLTSAAGVALYAVGRYNYLIFHGLTELFSIVIAFSIFVIAWNTRKVSPNSYLLFIGTSLFFVGFVDLLHALAYKGMGVFRVTGSNLATQLWIAGRYIQSVSLLCAPWFIGRRLRTVPLFAVYVSCLAIVLLSLYYGVFPDAFIENRGLTPFKITSEYIVSFLLALAIVYLRRKRTHFDRPVLNMLTWSIGATIASELAFTLYVDVYGFFNALGHFFKVVSVYLFYVALVRTSLTKPYEAMATEIEERKAAEETLREREEFITRLLDASPVAMVVSSGMDERVVLVNRKFTELFGYTMEDMPDVAHWWPLAYPDPELREKVRAEWAGGVERAIRNLSEIEPIEAVVRCKDGSRRYIEFRFSSIGQWHLVTFTDLTARKRAEAEREQYFKFFQTSSDLMCIADPNGALLKTNPAFTELLGYSETELTAKPFIEFVHPDDRQPTLEEMARQLKTGFSLNFENRYTCKDGSLRWLSWRAIYDSDEGTTYAAARDITERKSAEQALRESEARLKEAQRIAHLGHWELDLERNVLYWSDEVYRIFGIAPQEFAATYEAFLEHVHPDDRALVNEAYATSVKNRTGYDIEHRVLLKSGEIKYVNERCGTEYDAGGKPLRSIGTVLDITELRKAGDELRTLNEKLEERVRERTADLQKKGAELLDSQSALTNIVEDLNLKTAELEQANLRLKELDRLKSMFIASMSHELRTPLNSIIGFSSILFDEWLGPLNQEQKDNLGVIRRSGRHLLSLINDVIDVSKVEAGVIERHVEDFDLFDVITEAVTTFSQDINEKGLEMRVEAVHEQMHTDRRRLLQCILNLISNAVKFTEKGSITVQALVTDPGERERREGRKLIEIAVTDTGIGIREESMPKLCHAFVRIESPLKAKVPGTGLGLYLTKRLLAEVLKGEIMCTSRYEEGSRFAMKVPVSVE